MDLEHELRDLVARREIERALLAYMRGQDRLDPDLQHTAFHPGADVDCGLFRGTGEEFTQFAQDLLGGMEGSQHLMGQADITVEGDRGYGEVYFMAWHRSIEDGAPFDMIMAGRYVDEYASINGKWAISKRRLVLDWARKDKASDSFLRDMPPLRLGGRRGGDFSQLRNWTED